MRGGLWQKQKRPSACLLRLYSHGSYSSTQALRLLANPATRRPTAITGNGAIFLTGTTTTRQFGGKFMPKWGMTENAETSAEPELLPHELAAREAARAAKAAKDAAAKKVAEAEAERAAKEAEARKAAEAARLAIVAESMRAAEARMEEKKALEAARLAKIEDSRAAIAAKKAEAAAAAAAAGQTAAGPTLLQGGMKPIGRGQTSLNNSPLKASSAAVSPADRYRQVLSERPISRPRQASRPIPPANPPSLASKPSFIQQKPALDEKPLSAGVASPPLAQTRTATPKTDHPPAVGNDYPTPQAPKPKVTKRSPFSSTISSWASFGQAEAEADGGLLPHERAALEHRRKKREEAEALARTDEERQRAEKEREQSFRPAAQRTDSYAHLLPHEIAAREQARRERQLIEKDDKPAAQAKTHPWDQLLPHEREAKQQAPRQRQRAEQERVRVSSSFTQAATPEKSASADEDRWAFLLPHERAALEQLKTERERSGVEKEKKSKDEVPLRQTLSQRAVPRDRERVGKEERQPQALDDRQLSQHLETTWKPGIDLSRPAPADPFQMTSDSPSRPAKQDPWTRLVRQAKEELEQTKEPRKTTATDDRTWDWVGDHVKESEEKKAAAATEAAGSEAPLNPNHANSEQLTESYRRHRFDVPEKEKEKEKPKKVKKRGYARDDDFDELDYQERRQQKAERKAEKERERLEALKGPIPILLPEFISVANLAVALKQKVKQFVKQLEELGFEDVSKDNIVTGETAALIAQEYGFEPTIETGDDYDLKPRPPPEDPSSLPPRPPVVTIMGHVDHGKTTLLDYLRKSSIVSQEHGGITQHIGAFSVRMSTGKLITFLDTPGHAAFLSMRQRGANVTDMVILVVAADDSVKPQTIEAIKHAQAAKVPIIVAINKIDKDSANIDRVKSDLAVNGLEIEDHGGDVQVVPVSGKTGQGMDDLEENILLLADMLDIRSETDGMAEGWVLESSIKPIGRAATVLVKRGTLRQGDFIVAGTAFTKIRSLRNEAGQEVTEAPPGTAVEVLGWKDPPEAGDLILQAPTEDRAKEAVHYRQEFKEREEVIAQMAEQEQAARKAEIEREKEEKRQKALEDGEEYDEDADPESSIKYVNFTVKADVHGSVEAVTASILEQGNNQVRPKVLQSSSGQITESDVEHAAVSGASIVNFNNPIPGHIKRQAHDAGVKILDHNIIYHLIEDVTELLSEQLPPIISWRVVGEAEVLQIFPINYKGRKYKNIAGCRIRNGLITKNGRCRVLRGDKIVFEGTIDELKQGQKVISEIKKDSECGISFENWDDFKEGDHIQSVKEVVEKRTL